MMLLRSAAADSQAGSWNRKAAQAAQAAALQPEQSVQAVRRRGG
ncbi:hypothetical protein [Thermogemmata fonticola]|nr:hypothetical protein [Thermogemmata fonticola]